MNDSVSEEARLAALGLYDVLDTPSEESFHDPPRVVPAPGGGPRVASFAEETIRHRGITIVNDATTDERFAGHGLVTAQPLVRFYAGVPLVSTDGFPLGTLCVMDLRPRSLSAA